MINTLEDFRTEIADLIKDKQVKFRRNAFGDTLCTIRTADPEVFRFGTARLSKKDSHSFTRERGRFLSYSRANHSENDWIPGNSIPRSGFVSLENLRKLTSQFDDGKGFQFFTGKPATRSVVISGKAPSERVYIQDQYYKIPVSIYDVPG